MPADDTAPDEEPTDPAVQAAAEDGFATLRRYLAHHPMPHQRTKETAA